MVLFYIIYFYVILLIPKYTRDDIPAETGSVIIHARAMLFIIPFSI